jgi:hypothetical protein
MNKVQLERECRTYTRFLIGQAPTPYVLEHYLDFHQKSDVMEAVKSDRFDQFLVGVSARGPFWARLADSYASVFRKNSTVRKKLVLTLALLECAPPSFETLDRVDSGGALGAVIRLGWGAALYALTLIVSFVIFTPVRLGILLSSGRRSVATVER